MSLASRGRSLSRFISRLTLAPHRREIDELRSTRRPCGRASVLIIRQTLSLFVSRNLAHRSASITYHLILSLVPILGIAFTFFKAFGGLENLLEESIIPKITSYFDPAVSQAMGKYLQEFVSNMQTGTLGATALFTLLLTVISLMSAMETAFNEINDTRQERPWLQRLLNYWLLITLTPFVVVVSTAKSSELLETFAPYLPEGLTGGQHAIWRFITAYLVETCGFSMLYYVLPARRVTLRAAAVGGAFAAFGFESLQWVNSYATGRMIHEASLLQLYGSVPVIIVVLFIWMRLVAVVLLSGMAVASAVHRVVDLKHSPVDRRKAPVQALVSHVLGFAWVLQSFRDERHGVTVQSLCRKLNMARSEGLAILVWLEQTGCTWSHKESGKLFYSPTSKGLLLETNPEEFVRKVLRIEPYRHPDPKASGAEVITTESALNKTIGSNKSHWKRRGDTGLDPDLIAQFVDPALAHLAPLSAENPAKA